MIIKKLIMGDSLKSHKFGYLKMPSIFDRNAWRKHSLMGPSTLMALIFVMTFAISGLMACSAAYASSLTLTVSTDLLSTDIIPNGTAGSFATSNTANVSVTTDFTTGYTLSIKAGSSGNNATSLVNTIDNTKTISSITSTVSESDFSAAANTQYNNQWGYKPSKFNSVANTTNYYPSPTDAGDVLDVTSTSNSTANTYDISFGTRVGVETIPGTYSNTYIITAIGNPTPYSITYDKNTTDNVTNMPSPNPDIGGTYDDHVVLSSTKPERSGYKFFSWCTTDDSETSCSGTSYQAGDNFAVDPNSSTGNTVTLHAIWVKVAMLDTGENVNQKLKKLAGNSTAVYDTQDNVITALVRSNTLPNGFVPTTGNTISSSSSVTPIYAWYDSGSTTIYYYSEARTIMMNQNSDYFFSEMRALSDLSTISAWDTSKVTNMYGMFYYTGYNAAAFSLDLSSWDISSATDTGGMFAYTGYNTATFTLDLSSWDTSSVTNMDYMFYYAGRSATTWSIGDLSLWNTPSVINMSHMFDRAGYNASTWSIGDLSSWDTASVTDMSYTFAGAGYNATAFTLDLSGWDTPNVTDMSYMFSAAGYFNATTFSLDLSSWDTSTVTNMTNMFYNAGHRATSWSVAGLSSWDTSSVTDMSYMLRDAGYNATTFTLDLSDWNTSSVTNMTSMFSNAGYNATTFTLDLSDWNTSSVTNMTNMFYRAGYNASTWSATISKTNNGTATGPIPNTTSNLYGNSTSVTATPDSGKSFTLAN